MEKYFIASLTAANHVGSKTVQQLINFFGSAENVWNAEADDLQSSGMSKKSLESFLQFRTQFPNAPENLVEFCNKKNFGLCSYVDEDYPPLLKEISIPPAVFYYRGTLEPFAQRIAMVGTRDYTSYGRRVALEISEELDKIISDGGLVLSEFEPNLPPNTGTFPARNRIIAGLCKGVIVVEAGSKSGALLTTNDAADYGRDVFAVPGSIHSDKSTGCHALIRDGGNLITCAADVLEFYNLAPKEVPEKILGNGKEKISKVKSVALDETEKKVFNLIPLDENITVDEILMQIDELEPSEISEILLRLEVKNVVQEDGGTYTRIN